MTIVRFQPVNFKTQKSNQSQKTGTPISNRLPAVNISEDDKAFHISLATPGMNRSDFEIQLEQNKIIVKGKAATEEKTTENGFFKRDFEKSFLIPDRVNTELITAKSKDGILNIILPKNDKVVTVKIS